MSPVAKILSSGVLATALLGCNGSFESQEIPVRIRAVIQANTEAESHVEWETSPSSPELLFEKLKAEGQPAEKVCAAFLSLPFQSLTLFEESIKSEDNADLVAPCKETLIGRIEDFYRRERVIMYGEYSAAAPRNSSGFRFKDATVTRDLSLGYKVVTGDLNRKQIILTFDDGPHPQHTENVLGSLRSVNAKAIFFTLGQNVNAYPALAKKVANDGHSLGGHSMSHLCLPHKKVCQQNNKGRMLSFAEAKAEIAGSLRALRNVLGWVDPFFRFPYGESSAELSQYLRGGQVAEFFWNVDSNDWRVTQTPSSIIKSVTSDLNAAGRGVLLFHDIHRRTAEALPALLKELYFAGYEVVLMKASDPNARHENKLLQ